MKPLQILGIIICLLLVLSIAGCTGSKTPTQQPATTEKAPIVEQPSLTPTTEQTTPSSSVKQPAPSTGRNKEIPAQLFPFWIKTLAREG